MAYGMIGKEVIFMEEAKEIIELIKKIEKIDGITTFFQHNSKNRNLNSSDLNYIKLNEELINKIIHLANVSHQNNIPLLNRTYFKGYGYDIKENVITALETFDFYKLINKSVNYNLIEYTKKLLNRFTFGKKDTVKLTTYLADAYFDIKEEEKAYKIAIELIDKHQEYDEAYQVVINWYMYKKSNIKILEKILKKANANNHMLVSGGLVYQEIIEYYKKNDKEKYEKYINLYEKWALKYKFK